MPTVTRGYIGPNVEIIEVELDVAETDETISHGLGGQVLQAISPKDAGFYTQQVLVGAVSETGIQLLKTAGAIANCELILTSLNSRQNG